MKLSTAILKGSKGKKQIKRSLYDGEGYCVLGAACLGVGIVPRLNSGYSQKLRILFPFLGYSTNENSLTHQIIEKNDSKNWSFIKIAKWLQKKGY